MNKTNFAALRDLFEGKTVSQIVENHEADCGLIIVFNDAQELRVGYSAEEGSIKVLANWPTLMDVEDF